jgi:hypothetical protein
MNGENAPYDSANPLCDADYPDAIGNAINTEIFAKLGISKISSYLYDIIAQVMRFITEYLPF